MIALRRAGGFFDRREVQVLRRRVEHPVAGEDAERREGVCVWVEVGEVSEGLRRDDHSGDGVLELGELSMEERLRGGRIEAESEFRTCMRIGFSIA